MVPLSCFENVNRGATIVGGAKVGAITGGGGVNSVSVGFMGEGRASAWEVTLT